MVKLQKSTALEVIKLNDEQLSKYIVSWFLKHPSFRTLKNHCKSLELSCNGIVWLSVWLAFIYLVNKKHFFEMQINMLIGLLVDIFIVAILKAICRRKRPIVPNDMLVLGPDKFSLPSGHASRSCFIALFFIYLSPISQIWWLPLTAWCLSICLSRVLIQRHYVLDVVAGIAVGVVEACLLNFIWINESGAQNILNFILTDDLPIDIE